MHVRWMCFAFPVTLPSGLRGGYDVASYPPTSLRLLVLDASIFWAPYYAASICLSLPSPSPQVLTVAVQIACSGGWSAPPPRLPVTSTCCYCGLGFPPHCFLGARLVSPAMLGIGSGRTTTAGSATCYSRLFWRLSSPFRSAVAHTLARPCLEVSPDRGFAAGNSGPRFGGCPPVSCSNHGPSPMLLLSTYALTLLLQRLGSVSILFGWFRVSVAAPAHRYAFCRTVAWALSPILST